MIECRFNELHFELFHEIFLSFYMHMELYKDLKNELEKEGYSVIVKAVEIGARGFVVPCTNFWVKSESKGVIEPNV